MSEQKYKVFWDEALNMIEEEYKAKNQGDEFTLWFNMVYQEDNGNDIKVSIPSEFMWKQVLIRGSVDLIKEKIKILSGQDIEIVPVITNKTNTPKAETKPNNPIIEEKKENSAHSKKEADEENMDETESEESYMKSPLKKHPQLHENYTFDTFVPGENSDFAYSACLAASREPGKKYNPMLIYGGVGLGKTHLMESIGNYIYNKSHGEMKICCVTAEDFTNEFTSSIRNKTTEKFKSKYRNMDIFLVDDIHFLQGKEQTLEEFFHTFEALEKRKRQMVFTCDRPITELKGIEDRMRSRFTKGISIDLQPPSYETRRAILQKKLEIMGKTIPDEVVDYIAQNVETNVRDLEQCLTKMIAYSELIHKPLTIEVAQNQLHDTVNKVNDGSITIEVIQKVIADHYNISVRELTGKSRSQKIAMPRQIAIYIAREMIGYSFPELGNEFGGRDHTTTMHSFEKIDNLLKTDTGLNSTIEMLKREIKEYRK